MPAEPAPRPWWHPDVYADNRPLLVARARIRTAIRAWFDAQGFLEVEPSCLQVSPGNETHLHAFATELINTDLTRSPLYLHTSPEFAMKKLLAAGEPKIFTFAPVFRNRERSSLHAPEFSMLEWYRAGADYTQLWQDCHALLQIAADVASSPQWSFRERHCTPASPPQILTVDRAFRDLASIDLAATYDAADTRRDALAVQAASCGIRTAQDDSWSDIFSRVVVEKLEPNLGHPVPTVLYGYPIHEAALARPDPAIPHRAERFELYCCGVELANGFGELADPQEQQRRLELQMEVRASIYGDRYPIDPDFIAALGAMPAASGCALGFDRLVMLATGAQRIEQVQWTPLPPAP